MLKTRIITAAIGVPILLGVLYLGGFYWQGLISIMAGMVLLEYTAMMRHKGFSPIIVPALAITMALLFSGPLGHYFTPFLFMGWLLMIIFMVVNYPRFNFSDLALSFCGAFYSGYLLSYAIKMPKYEEAFVYMMMVLFLTWASDIGGYMFGMLWGKHRLTPQLSPAKTWEGVAGALFLTTITAISFKYIFHLYFLSLFYSILLGICASAAAQLGDLLESAVKRYFGVKDSGNIIPGHGGVMDRFDSFMLVLPTVYYFLVVFV